MYNSPPSKQITNEQIASLFAASIFLIFSTRNLILLINQFKISLLITLVFNLVIVIIYLIRRPPIRASFSIFDILISIMGTFSTFFLIGSPDKQEMIIFQILQILGLLISVSGLIFINKSFGIIPADRGIVTDGIYRFVRHPIYAGYFISSFGFLVQNYTMWNTGVFISIIVIETTRVLREEVLLKKNPIYIQYTQKTHWRFLPYIW